MVYNAVEFQIMIKVTKELLQQLYAEYNEIYFGGVLGKCEFFLFPKTTSLS